MQLFTLDFNCKHPPVKPKAGGVGGETQNEDSANWVQDRIYFGEWKNTLTISNCLWYSSIISSFIQIKLSYLLLWPFNMPWLMTTLFMDCLWEKFHLKTNPQQRLTQFISESYHTITGKVVDNLITHETKSSSQTFQRKPPRSNTH